MTAQLVLHIGDPKTGSSSIQQALFERRVACDTVSLDYPAKLNAIQLANAIRKDGQMAHRDARFTEAARWLAASQADVAVLSAEQFSSIAAPLVRQVFAQYMPDHVATMRVIAYVRPHVSRFLSAYAQRTKVGSLHTDLQSFYNEMRGERFLNFSRRFDKWRATFGDRFILRPMIREELRDGDVVADFAHVALNGAAFHLIDVAQANATLPVEALSGLRFVQMHLLNRGLSGGSRHAVGSQVNRLCGSVPIKGSKLRISARLYDLINASSREDAEHLDAEFFGRPVMTKALDQAGADTTDQTPDTDAHACFPPETLARLAQAASGLADLLQERPENWQDWFARDVGQAAPLAKGTVLSPDALAHIDRVNAIMTEIVALITGR